MWGEEERRVGIFRGKVEDRHSLRPTREEGGGRETLLNLVSQQRRGGLLGKSFRSNEFRSSLVVASCDSSSLVVISGREGCCHP